MADLAPDGSGAAAEQTTDGQAPATTDIVNLDSLSEFKYQDQTFTPDSWGKIYSEHKQWAEQVPKYQEAQKFQENLEIDIDKVLNDPSLVNRFKQVYPQAYHGVIDRFLGQAPKATAQASAAQSPALPKEFLNEFGQVKATLQQFVQASQQAKVQAESARLDAVIPKLMTKYPLASEIEILNRAEKALADKQQVTDAVFERYARESHQAYEKRADQHYSTKLKAQQEKGAKGRDIGVGGGAPGHAQVKPRTFDEAREAMLKSVGAR